MKKLLLYIKRFLWLFKNLFHKYSEKEKKIIKENKKLIKEFPFLLPKNRFNGRVSYDYDYTYTELDDMPEGWRNTFGIEMCEKIKKCLLKADYLNKYRITQIKEKWGTLRWYDMGVPISISEEYYNIINYYEDKSMLVCLDCGKPTKYVTKGWIEYMCDDCLTNKLEKQPTTEFFELTWTDVPIRTLHENEKTKKTESVLKGEMMCTWKRYSKYNLNKLKQTLNNIKEARYTDNNNNNNNDPIKVVNLWEKNVK